MIRYALLALLREQSDHGYQLKQRFESLVGPSWRLNIGQVYQTLRVLEGRRQVAEVHETSSDALTEMRYPQRSRRRFAITVEGLNALERWLTRPAGRIPPMRDELAVQLLGLERHRREACRPLLKARQRLYRRHLGQLLAFRERLAHDDRRSRVATGLAIEGQLLQVQAYLDWLDLCERALATGDAQAEPAPMAAAVRGTGRA